MGDPVRLTHSLVPKPWGKEKLGPWFPDGEKPIGEAWFVSQCDLPLLVKLLFTSDRLSVQVHPDDGEAGPRGKTEMWHILEADPGAEIALGFREPITRERLRESALTGEIVKLLKWFPVSAGQTFLTPAHTVHAIGAGIVLCEIQQNCDITYRLYDYGSDRPLHLEQAVAIADLGVHSGACQLPVSCSHFVTESVCLPPGAEHQPSAERCQLWICLEGCGQIGGEPVRKGEVLLLPETGPQPLVRAQTSMDFLRTHVPGTKGTA